MVVISDHTKRGDWMAKVIRRKFAFKDDMAIRYLGSERSFILTDDEIARQQMLLSGAIFEGVKLVFPMWLKAMFTIDKCLVIQKEHWVHVIDISHHLWCTLNAEIIDGAVGEC